MADPVGAIRVALSVDSAAFEKGLNRARGRLDNWGSRIRANIATMAKWAAGVAAAGVAIGSVFVRNAMKAIDALAKTADRLGMTTEGLARLRHAAEQTGVSANTLDMAMQRMTRRISEAANGTGEAQDALKELGLDAKALAQMRPEDAFQQIAGAMENVQSQGERVRLAFKLFDSEGVALVNTLRLGEEGLRTMGEEADALGLSLSRVDAAQVEAASDAIDRARKVIDGVVNRITVYLAPYIEAVSDKFAQWAIETDGFKEEIDKTFRFVVKAVGWGSDAVEVWMRYLRALFGSLVNIANVPIQAFRDVANALGHVVNIAVDGMNLLIKAGNKFRTEDWDLIPRFHETDAIKKLNNVADSVEGLAEDTIGHVRDITKIFDDLPSEGIEEWFEGIREKAKETADGVREEFGGGGGDDDDENGDGGPGIKPTDLEAERELLAQRLEMLREHMMSEQELEVLRHEERLELLREALENELLTKEEFKEMEADLEAAHAEKLTSIADKAARERAAIEERVQRDITSMRETAMNNAIGLLQTFGQQSRVAALAAIALNKGLQIAQTLQNTATAEMRALAELGPIAGPPMAAKIRAWGMANVGLIAAQGLAQAAAGGVQPAGGVGRSGGGSAGGAIADTQAPAAGGGAPTQRTVHLNIVGDVFDQKTIRNLAEQINEFAEDGFRLTVKA